MKHIKIITLSLGLVILSTLAFVGVANAQSFKAGDMITVPANENIDSMLFAGGNNINIAGNVNGDVYCAGENVIISGIIKGDVFCAGRTITISGTVEGSVRLAGQSITIGGIVGNSATIATQDLIIGKEGVINRDLLGGSQNVIINGQVKRDIVAGSESLIINGNIGRDINGDINAITIGASGQVAGNINYTGLSDPNIANGGGIIGTVTRTTPKNESKMNFSPVAFAVGFFIYMLIAVILVSTILVMLFPRIFKETADKAIKMPAKTALVGAGAMVFVPISIMILMMSFIGIPLAILVMMSWIIIMIISTPFAGYLLGRLIMPKSKKPIYIIIAGSSVLIVSFFIPIVGFITMIAAYLFGTGMIVSNCIKIVSKNSASK